MRAIASILVAGTVLAVNAPPAISAEAVSTVGFLVTNESGGPIGCRIYLRDKDDSPQKTPLAPFWEGGSVFPDGKATFTLPPGAYRYEVERGPEWTTATGNVEVGKESPPQVLTESLRRITNLRAEGWFCGDLHVHRAPNEAPIHLLAEDLDLVSVQTWWNEKNPWEKFPARADPLQRTGSRFYHTMSGEDERGGGALLFHRMDAPIDITGSEREWPASVTFLERAKKNGAWVEIEKPFWWDTPVWLATGLIDSIGIAQNHLQRRGMLENEAWGRARDRKQFPGIGGNGRYTQDLYYKILNCGFRIPPSAGSASGVLKNPVGYDRIYVRVDGELTWDKWWDRFKAGRVFVTNGPLLRVTANDHHPGAVLKSETGPIQVRLEGKLDSRDPIKSVELVQNGKLRQIKLPTTIEVNESGWFLVRAIADIDYTFRFASTAPWYVEIGGEQMKPIEADAEFFLDWSKTRRESVAQSIKDETKRNEALKPQEAAVRFWEELERSAR